MIKINLTKIYKNYKDLFLFNLVNNSKTFSINKIYQINKMKKKKMK